MSKVFNVLPTLLVIACPLMAKADTLKITDATMFIQPFSIEKTVPAPKRKSLIDHHKNARVYLPFWDTRTLKMSVPWDAGYDMPSKPRTTSLLGTSGDVFWATRLRPEPADPSSAKLAAVSLPASAFFMTFGLLSIWMAAASRKTQAVRRRYN